MSKFDSLSILYSLVHSLVHKWVPLEVCSSRYLIALVEPTYAHRSMCNERHCCSTLGIEQFIKVKDSS